MGPAFLSFLKLAVYNDKVRFYAEYLLKYNRRSYNDNYLIYDIDGYEYDYTYRNSKDNLITPVLRYDNNRWKYTIDTSVSAGFRNLTDGDEIYVVYKKRAEPPSGGSPQPDPQSEHPDPATITKLSKDNKDGTNTLSLSVTGHTKVLETKKMADVIVIYDVSGSMDYVMNAERKAGWNERSRMDEAEDAEYSCQSGNHSDIIRISFQYYPDAEAAGTGTD